MKFFTIIINRLDAKISTRYNEFFNLTLQRVDITKRLFSSAMWFGLPSRGYLLVASIAAGLILTASIISYMSSFDAFETVKQTLSHNRNIASQSDPGSTGVRLGFAYQGVMALQDNLVFGLGAHREPYLAQAVQGGHLHLHNNYLSWLIWGGLITLTSGLIWLFAPVILISKSRNFTIAIPCLMIALLWSVSLLFDSFLSWKNFTYVYIALICLGYQISRSNAKAAI